MRIGDEFHNLSHLRVYAIAAAFQRGRESRKVETYGKLTAKGDPGFLECITVGQHVRYEATCPWRAHVREDASGIIRIVGITSEHDHIVEAPTLSRPVPTSTDKEHIDAVRLCPSIPSLMYTSLTVVCCCRI